MDIIDRLNAFYTIKFTEQFDILNRGDRKYYLLNTFDDKKYLLKIYKKNTNNSTKLKDSNNVTHMASKQMYLFNDYIFSKDYEPIVDLDENEIGTLYGMNDGEFISHTSITKEHLHQLSDMSIDFHKIGYELYERSFTIKQVEHINTVIKRNIEKIRSEINENGIHYLLENKFGLKFDRDILDLNLSHVESINDRAKDTKPTILNMDCNFDNVTFFNSESNGKKLELHVTNVIFDRVYTGHPYFELGKTISRLVVHQKQVNAQDLKKIFLKEIEDQFPLQDQIIDSLICFYLIDMLYKYIRYETYREEEERFTVLKTKLIKEKILNYI